MPTRVLPQDIVALVHHVELAAAGWRERLSEQLLLVGLAEQRGPCSVDAITRAISHQLGRTMSATALTAAAQRLIGRGLVVSTGQDTIALSQAGIADVERRQGESRALLSRVTATFTRLAAEGCPDSDPALLWTQFQDACLEPLVAELGARTYQFLSGGQNDAGSIQSMSTFVNRFPAEQQLNIKTLIHRFLSPDDRDVRDYVLQLMNAHFLSLAVGLSDQTLTSIATRLRHTVQLKLFLDTNFLFSVLDLHDNPANDAAAELVSLLNRVRGKLDCTLYVYPLTVDEAQRALAYYEGTLAAAYMTPKLGRAALASGAAVSGIVLRYLRAVSEAKGRISAHDFLLPYLTDMLSVLRAKGVELYNANLDGLTTSQPVIDDIVDQQAFDAERYPDRAKPYEALRHDIALWHLVNDRRGSPLVSPLDAIYWIVTIDYRFLGFDAHKQRESASSLPVCVHPAVLLQMLQLWLPRDEVLDRALFQGVRSLLPQVFDTEAEQTTIRILTALARYEDVDDLPTDTVAHVLVNQALRGRIRLVDDVTKQVDLVRDAIVSQVAEARAQVAAAEARRLELEKEVAGHRDAARAEGRRVEDRYDALSREKSAVDERLRNEAVNREALQQRVDTLEHSIRAMKDADLAKRDSVKRARQSAAFVLITIVGIAGALTGGLLLPAAILKWLKVSSATATALGWTGSVGVGGGLVSLGGNRLSTVKASPWFAKLIRILRLAVGAVWLVFLGLVSIYLWEHR